MKKTKFISLKIVLSLVILLLGNLFYFTQVSAQSCPSGYIQSGSAHTEESNCINSLSNFQNFAFECTLNKTCDIYSVIDCQSLAFSNTTQVRTFVSRQSTSEPLGAGQCYNSGCRTNADCAGASTSSCISTCSASGGGPNVAGYCSSCSATTPRVECVYNKGQSCDDNNPDTANDKIQCDGSCAGTTPTGPGGGGGNPSVTLRRCSAGSCALATFSSDDPLVLNGSLTNECSIDADCKTNLVTEITPISNTINKGESTAIYNVKFKFDGGLKKAALNIRALFNGSGASNVTWSGSGFNAVSTSSNNGTLGFGGGTERNLFLRIKNPESLNPGTFGVSVSAQTGDVSGVGADNLYNFNNCFGNCNSSSAASLVVTEPTPTSCTNGATNPPACNNNTPAPCPSGSSRVNGVCVPNTNPTPCTNGATNPPACNNNVPGACTNGATNPGACNHCASGFSMVSGTCTPTTPGSCANGATNPPACNNNVPGACTNGATNPGACNHCASGYSFNGTMCVEQVSMSGSISSTPPSCSIPLGGSSCNVTLNWNTTNPEAVSAVTSSYPVANTNIADGNNGGKTVSIPHFSSPRPFYLYNNGTLIDQVSVAANCVLGTVWDINTSKCIASNVTVMSGVLTPDRENCVIPTGANACTIQFSWMTIHPEAVSAVVSDTTDTGNPQSNTNVANGNNGGPAPFIIPYPSRNFYLYNNGVLLDQKSNGTITATCATDASFDVSRNKCMSTVPNNPGSGLPGGGETPSDINFDASPKNIFTGQPTTLTWSSSFACTGTNFSTGGASSGNVTLRPVTTTTYTVTCGTHSKSVTVVVRRQPGFIEQ